jgi:glycosyltransferase involved in cell wall biosynthesis
MDIHLAFVCYNRLEYTKRALASVLAEPRERFQLTIWDNASKDGTVEYLKTISDPRIEDIMFSKENVGQIEAVNRVWTRARSDLVGKLDNDCILTPNWTVRLAQAHQDISNLGVVACWHYFLDDFDYARARRKIQQFGSHLILRHPWTCGTGLLIKREMYKRFGPIVGPGTSRYWLNMALHGCVNGFYYPLILQEHMDDPKSRYSMLKDEESYQAAKAVTFNINRHGQHTLADRWRWRQEVLDDLLTSPWQAECYVGWRSKVRKVIWQLKGRSPRKIPSNA